MMHRPGQRSVWLTCGLCAVLAGMFAAMLLLLSGSSAAIADEPEAKPRYEQREDHDPNGTGKFYFGREIAMVMTFHGAPWLERPEREEEERLSRLVDLLQLKPGMVCADVGAGSGVITMMMAEAVGPKGKVYAVDIQQEMLDLLSDKLNRLDVKNIDLVLGTEKSPKLKAGSVDLALMVDVYHEFDYPYEMILELSRSLKVGGKLVFVEYRREDPQVPIKLVHKMSEAQVKRELDQLEFGLRWKETLSDLPRQHVIVFERRPAGKADTKPAPKGEKPAR